MADAPTPDELRAIAIRARNSSGSASDDCGPSAYVLAGWNAAIAAQPPAAPLTGGDERRHIICLCPDCVKPSAAITQAADAGAAEPVVWPRDAAEVRKFMKGNCASLEWAVDEATPHQDDRYQLTAHDFLSAVNWWADFPHLQAAQQLQQAVARAVEKCAVICEGMHEEDRPGDYAAAIRQQGTP